MSTPDKEALRDQFERAYATEWHTTGGRNKSTIAELTEVIKTWRNGDTYDDDLPRLRFGWEGFQWHAAATARRVQLAAERKGRIYVAGPMTGYPDLNFPAFHTAAAQLREQGWHVENPADHGEVPGAEWADYMHVDVAMLASCCAIYLLPGWSKSRGGSVEAQLAHSLGMEIHFAEGAERLKQVPPSIAETVAAMAINSAIYRIGLGDLAGALQPLEEAKRVLTAPAAAECSREDSAC